jgi:anti-anti-sigma regulatory factor
MLEATISQGNTLHLRMLLDLPATVRIGDSGTAQLLEAAIAAGQDKCSRLLCKRPEVQQLSGSVIA